MTLRGKASAALTLAALALVAGGCGGEAGSAVDAKASFAPADTALYISVDADPASDQWETVQRLADKFPGKARLIAEIKKGLAEENLDYERDVKPALGGDIGFAIFTFAEGEGNGFFVVKPDKAEAFRKLLVKSEFDEDPETPIVREEIDGWTLIADGPGAITRAKQAHDGDSLADSEVFANALEDLPEQSLGQIYVSGKAFTAAIKKELEGQAYFLGTGRIDSIAGAIEAQDDGISVVGSFRGEGTEESPLGFTETYSSKLVDEVPAGVLAFASFRAGNYRQQLERLKPAQREQLNELEQMLGFSANDVIGLFEQEGAIYVRQGTPIPEVTLVALTDDERKALGILDKLASKASALGGPPPRQTEVDGVKVKTLQLGPVTVTYGAFDGKVVVTTQSTAFSALREDGKKLSDDEDYKDAVSASGMPDETSGIFYLNIEDSVPLLESLAGFADESDDIPQEAIDNLRPLRSFVFWGEGGEGHAKLRMFLQIE